MASFKACPRCGRTISKGLLSGSWFPLYTCWDCKTKYCTKCGGSSCPKCGQTKRGQYDEVNAT